MDWTKVDRVQDESQVSSSAEGYALHGQAGKTDTGTPRVVTPQGIRDEYALVGAVTQEAANGRPDSTYALVGPGGSLIPSTNVTPAETTFADYAVVGFPIGAGGESTPLPTGRPRCPVRPRNSTQDEAGKQAESSVPVRNSSHNSHIGLRTANGDEGGPMPKSGIYLKRKLNSCDSCFRNGEV